jgi:hypothetical protein
MLNRDLAKIAINYYVAGKATQAVKSLVEHHTSIEDVEDNLVVRIGCDMLGLAIAGQTKPYVSIAVDKLADRWQERKAKKAAEKYVESHAPAV